MTNEEIATAPKISLQALESLLVVRDGDSLQELGARVQTALGLSTPVPPAALRRMLVDEDYFHNLVASRSAPEMLAHLLRSPGNSSFEESDDSESEPAGSGVTHSAPRLMAKAASAFVEWSKGGFSRVDSATYERRLAACLACDQLSAAPDTVLYKVAGLFAADKRSCRACGCLVTAKARLPHENCPLPDSTRPGLSRWGQPS